MTKVFMIEYVLYGHDRTTNIESKAFKSYRAASEFLLENGYEVGWHYNPFSIGVVELEFSITEEETDSSWEEEWVANIHELELID